VRFVRALWPIVLLIPLSWWADRGCGFAGVDSLYHATVWIHERLGWFVAALAAASVLVVIGKIVVARLRFSRLLDLAEATPERVCRAFAAAATELGVRVPHIAYLDVSGPIATTVFGPVVLLSRGFADALNDDDLLLVARHELVHASRHDASVGVLWHLAFAALLLPGFEPLERRLHAARERRANAIAADLTKIGILRLSHAWRMEHRCARMPALGSRLRHLLPKTVGWPGRIRSSSSCWRSHCL
jgi:Zn-dependent protease with chaperone function